MHLAANCRPILLDTDLKLLLCSPPKMLAEGSYPGKFQMDLGWCLPGA